MASITGLYTCPDCERSISFPNTWLNHNICICGSVICRDEEEHLQQRPLPVIREADERIQPGTIGSWNGMKFIITGRFRVWFDGAVFNYWTLDAGDDRLRYLGEGYGLYAIYEQLDIAAVADNPGQQHIPYRWPLVLKDGGWFTQIKKSKGYYLEVEGAFYKPEGTKVNSYEALADDGRRLEILEYDKKTSEIFQVFPVAADTLELGQLRDHPLTGKNFRCKCGKENKVEGYPYVQSWVCDQCDARYSLLRISDTEGEGENRKFDAAFTFLPGEKLELQGVSYTVTGCALKADSNSSDDQWREYSLYHKLYGFSFLTEAQGHWMLMKETIETPLQASAQAEMFTHKGKQFYLFNKYRFRILQAQGVFPGNIFDSAQDTEVTDFIGPPEIWSAEQSDKGLTWYYGAYISKKEIAKQSKRSLPSKLGIGPAEPKATVSTNALVLYTALIILVAMLIHLAMGMSNREKVLLDSDYTLSDSLATSSFTTDKFELTKWKSNLQFDIVAPVDNTWFEMSASLVNASTGDEYSLEQGVEYYHGYSDGESWAEGEQTETAYLNSIPSGTYYLQINGMKESGTAYPLRSFHVKIINDTPMQRNFWIVLMLLLIWPLYKIIMANYHEKSRWSSSAYSKYNYS